MSPFNGDFDRDGLTSRLDALMGREEEREEPRASTKAVKRVPLSELGDWFCPVISLVARGQVPKAKIVSLKSEAEHVEQQPRQRRARDRHGRVIEKPHGLPGAEQSQEPRKRRERDGAGRVISKPNDPRRYGRAR